MPAMVYPQIQLRTLMSRFIRWLSRFNIVQCKLMAINLAELLNLPSLSNYLMDVDKELLAAIKSENNQIYAQALRLLKAKSKRLRPALVIACASLNDKPINAKTIKLGAAVELLHLGSLVHDDIIDGANIRRDVPTINSKEGLSFAIIVGDFLLASACALSAEVGQQEASLVASTITKLCIGQSYELADQFNINRREEAYYKSIDGKTAVLLSLACALGGISSALDKEQIEVLREYAHNFGRSFQLIDDLMDLISNEKLYGKPIGNDIVEGVYTLPIILGLKSTESQKIRKILLTKKFDPKLTQLVIKSGAINQTLSIIRNYNHQAAAKMQIFNSRNATSLQKLPKQYLNWALDNLVDPSYRSDTLIPS